MKTRISEPRPGVALDPQPRLPGCVWSPSYSRVFLVPITTTPFHRGGEMANPSPPPAQPRPQHSPIRRIHSPAPRAQHSPAQHGPVQPVTTTLCHMGRGMANPSSPSTAPQLGCPRIPRLSVNLTGPLHRQFAHIIP